MLVLSMGPNDQNPQGDSGAVNKLEQDLQNLTEQASVAEQPVPIVPPVPMSQQVSETPTVVPTTQTPPPVPAESAVSVQEVPKKGSPLMIIAIVLAVIAVLAVVAYVFGARLLSPQPTPTPIVVVTPSPTPDVAANWKTYTNTKWGYSFKYPSQWGIYPSDDVVLLSNDLEYIKENMNWNYDKPFEYASSNYGFINLSMYKLGTKTSAGTVTNQTDIKTYVQKLFGLTYTSVTDITLDGKPAVAFVSDEMVTKPGLPANTQECPPEDAPCTIPSGRKIKQVWTKIGGNLLFMVYGQGGSYTDVDKLPSLFDQILSTFKFIEATPSGSPVATTSEIPADLIAAVKQNAADQSNPKVTTDKVVIGQFQVEGNYASVAFGYTDGGGAIFWLTKTGGTWKVVIGGQEPPSCSTLKSYNFPADFSCSQ